MLVGILYSSDKKQVEEHALALQKGLEEQGYQVRPFADSEQRFGPLASCKHVFVGSHITALFKPRTPRGLQDALAKAPGLAGKRTTAFLAGGGMSERKALVRLMNDMEKYGCYMVDQQTFSSKDEAYQFGRQVELKT